MVQETVERCVKHALNDFKKIFDMVNKSYPNTNNRILQTMLIFTIAVSFEIKAGKVTKDKFVNINDNEEYKSLVVSSRVFMDNRQFYIKEFDNNYYYNFKTEYRFFKFIEIYIRTRIFDMKTFKKDMEDIINTVDTDKLPGYKRLLTEEYWKISDDQFPKVISEVLESVKKGEIQLIDLIKIYTYFVYFIKKGLVDYDIQTINSVFLNGMNVSSITSEYCPDAEEQIKQLSIDENVPEMQEILSRFRDLNNQLKDKMYRVKADTIFKNIPMKMEKFYDMFDKECMDIPIFKYSDPYQIFQRISCASNEDIVTIKEKLVDRADKNAKILLPELNNIHKLKQVVDDYIGDKTPNIKVVMLQNFSEALGEIIEKYNTVTV